MITLAMLERLSTVTTLNLNHSNFFNQITELKLVQIFYGAYSINQKDYFPQILIILP